VSEFEMVCHGDRRRPYLRSSPALNGIDYAEVEEVDGRIELHLFLLRSLPPDGGRLFDAENIRIDGGVSIVDLEVDGEPSFLPAPDPARDDIAVVPLNRAGDQSRYTVRLIDTENRPLTDVDPRYRTASFSFAAGTTTDVDCLPVCGAASSPVDPPELSYLAKDYASFRRLLLDRLATTLPDWQERHGADLYLTLAEVMAYEADRLSYAQDAVGTEAYLDTARLRTSVRRHARLVDYAMHEGCNARAWVCLRVEDDPVLAADALSFVTRPARIESGSATLLPSDLARAPRGTYEVFEPLLPVGPATVTASDVLDPRRLIDRLLHDEDPALDYARGVLFEDERRPFEAEGLEDEDLPLLISALADRLSALLYDVGLVHHAPGGTERAVQRHGSLNALTGSRLAAHNRSELERLFPEELADPGRLRFHEAHNVISFYTWDFTECCLPAGATSATLRDDDGQPGDDDRPNGRLLRHLRPGDVLVLKEVLGPRSGMPADADPAHRHAVRLTSVRPGRDELRGVPVVEVTWDPADQLPFAFVLSALGPPPECSLIEDISVSCGNVVLVDHGETVREPDPVLLQDRARTIVAVPFEEPHGVVPAGPVELCCTREGMTAMRPSQDPPYEPVLSRSPLVHCEPLAPATAATMALRQEPARAVPALTVFGPVTGENPGGDVVERKADAGMRWPATVRYERWQSRRDLLSSGPDDRHVVAEVDDDGVAHLRFGNDQLGARPTPGTRLLASYRTGGGSAGNVGDGAIRHIVPRKRPLGGRIIGVSNPMPAAGGTDPEPVDVVRLRAPHAFRAHLERAVAAEDYAAIAQRDCPDIVQRAVAAVAVDAGRTIVTVRIDPVGTSSEQPALQAHIRTHLERFRRIGHTVDVRAAVYVAVDLAVSVRLLPGHQPGVVRGALIDRLSNRVLPDGTHGFFHPDRLTFGRPVPISAVLGAVYGVPGVAVARVTRLAPRGGADPMPEGDVLTVGPDEVVRLDNDPDAPEHGSLTIRLEV
jgi:hypothetical protein